MPFLLPNQQSQSTEGNPETEQKCFPMLTAGRQRRNIVRQTVSNGGSGDWEELTTFIISGSQRLD